jgi:hypothetical protein
MIQDLALRMGIPPAGVIAIGVLIALQLVLQVVALIDLSRRDAVVGGKKRIWVLAILLGNLLGAIIYLAVGRHAPRQSPDEERLHPGGTSRRALDELYGSDRDPGDP